MNSQTQPETIKSAKKDHTCSWCSELIPKASSYTRWRFFVDGDAGTVKMHPECYVAAQAEMKALGAWLEWTPGEYARGTVNEAN